MGKAVSTKFSDGELEPIDTRVAIRFDDVKGDFQETQGGILVAKTVMSKENIETRHGRVVGVGPNVKQCRVGDRVFVMDHSMAMGVVRRGTPPNHDQVLVVDEGQVVAVFRQDCPKTV